MPIGGELYEFSQANVDNSPAFHGVYALYTDAELTYIGRAAGDGVTIRSRLQSHKSGREGSCTRTATHYKRETTEQASAREVHLLEEYKHQHLGQLPRCNARVG